MKLSNRVWFAIAGCGVLVLVTLVAWGTGSFGNILRTGTSQAAAAALALSSDDTFAVLGGTTVTNTGSSVINGDLGLSPGTSVTGFPPGTVSGTQHITDGPAAQAQTDLTTAYNSAASQTPTGSISADLGGQTLAPGVYKSGSSIGLNGALTLDAGGDPNAVFIFQAGSTLTTGSGSTINLVNGAQACNVFWQVGSSATLGTSSNFSGDILAADSITDDGGSTVTGRLLASTAAVTLNNTTVNVPGCSHPAPLATLHVIKLVVNANGGTAVASDFSVHVELGGTNVSGSPQNGTSTPGTLYSLAAGTYIVSEGSHAGYTQTFTGDCDSSGNVTLVAGTPKTCTVVNTDIPPPVPIAPSVVSGGGGTTVVPLIAVLKVPSPLALPGGAGSVTYNYTVWNPETTPSLTGVSLTDDECRTVTMVSGDTNGNGLLDPGETWKYTCTAHVSTTTTDTAVATGYGNNSLHEAAVATAVATVVVGASNPPPLIAIVKVPSRLTPFLFGGGHVIYTYTATNPGIVALHDVSVTDNKCSPVTFSSGDANRNSLLDPGETWTYTCQTNVPVSTMNTATASGTANGFTAIAYAFATVLVSAPSLPNTGFSPNP